MADEIALKAAEDAYWHWNPSGDRNPTRHIIEAYLEHARSAGTPFDVQEILRCALASFKCTQNPNDYPKEHWSNRAISALNTQGETLLTRLRAGEQLSDEKQDALAHYQICKQASSAPTTSVWHPHHGGECPVSGDTVVEIQRFNKEYVLTGKACKFWWNHNEPHLPGDIMEYRIVKPKGEV